MIHRTRQEEAELQKWCISYLIYNYTYPRSLGVHIPNEGKRSERQGCELRRMGMIPGFPDIMILRKDTTPVFVEFKTEKGRQSPAQKMVMNILGNMGFTYVICRSRGEFVEICRTYIGKESNPDIERLREIKAL